MDYLVLEGSPYEIGKQKAEFDGDYLKKVMEYYNKEAKPAFEKWIKGKAIPYTEEEWPELVEEVHGYLDASGYDELSMYKYLFSQVRGRFTCSNVAIKTEDAGYVFAKNTDLQPHEFPHIFFFHYKPDQGQEFFGYSYKASFTVQGMNSKGLCNGGTSFSGVLEDTSSIPDVGASNIFIQRKIMQYAGTADEAIEYFQDSVYFDKASGLLFLDAAGNCNSMNRSMTVSDVRNNTSLPAFCTGFYDPDKYQYKDDFLPHVVMGKARLAYAEDFFNRKDKYYLQDVLDFLRSHGPDWSKPGQWCRHHPQEPHYRTCVSHICIPSRKTVMYCHGNPCETPYKEFVFED